MLDHGLNRQVSELFQDIDRWVCGRGSGGSKSFPSSKDVFEQLQKYCAASLKKYVTLWKLDFKPPNSVEVELSNEAAASAASAQGSRGSTLMPRGASPKKRLHSAMATSRGGSRNEAPAKRRVTEAPERSDQDHELTGLRIYLSVLLLPEQEELARNSIPALGGQVAEVPEEATHAVFPDDGQRGVCHMDWEEQWAVAQKVRERKGHLVSHKWLKTVLEGAKVPEQSLVDYMPDSFKQKIVHGEDAPAARVTRVQRSKAPDPQHFARSLQQTQAELQEEEDLKRAIAASMEDFALERHAVVGHIPNSSVEEAAKVLGLERGASQEEVKAAYRKQVLTSHPDKGGSTEDFGRVKHAYLTLMGGSNQAGDESNRQLRESQTNDFELVQHRALVTSLFEKDGVDLEQTVKRQVEALSALNLVAKNLGAVNQNERGEDIYNQCFYLALARSYLGTDSDSLKDTALHFKRAIETAVLQAHPDWGGSRVGEEIQAFSDFLFYVLGSHALLSELSVAIFDSTSGGVELYIGRHYPGLERSEEQRSNLLTLRYCPGHYEALVGQRRPRLDELQEILKKHNVLCVETKV